jgi:ATP-binding cassette, subfamily B, bacterial
MISGPTFGMRYIDDGERARQQIKPGTVQRVLPYFTRYRWTLVFLFFVTAVDSAVTVMNPVLLGFIVDGGILRRRVHVVVALSLAIAGLALLDALIAYIKSWYSARIGEGLVCELRSSVFAHVQRQPLAFFTRAQTGALVSRLNSDVNAAQRAVGLLLYRSVSTLMTLGMVLAAMFCLSWQISLVALALIPLFVFPGKVTGKWQQRFTREQMRLAAELATMTSERSNVSGAMLAKLYGRPDEEAGLFASRATRIRDVAVSSAMIGQLLVVGVSLLAGLTLVYGLGGALVVHGVFQLGTLVAMITLITRLYGPINQVSGMQVNFLTALVAFDRIFEILDLKPLITERSDAYPLPAPQPGGQAPAVEFDHVWFRYPTASEVSLPSLEQVTLAAPERPTDAWVLQDVSFRAPAGKLTALVGPSGAGKTTITHLVPRLYDVAGDRGYRLSGGEKQRVALARLLLKAPTVVILDEATAHLDSESELAVQRALKTTLAGRTSLVIAAPAVHHPRGGPDPSRRRGPDPGTRQSRRTARGRRALRRSVPDPVRPAGVRRSRTRLSTVGNWPGSNGAGNACQPSRRRKCPCSR